MAADGSPRTRGVLFVVDVVIVEVITVVVVMAITEVVI